MKLALRSPKEAILALKPVLISDAIETPGPGRTTAQDRATGLKSALK